MPDDAAGRAVLRAGAVHFIGIAGTGMQALAEVLLTRGVRVSGSDSRMSPVLEGLSAAGAQTFVGHAASQLGSAEAVVISAAVPAENPELRDAEHRNLPIATHAQVLGALSRTMETIAIAGTHGKSTTTALTAHILTDCGLDPVVLGGAYAPNLKGSGRAGAGGVLVVEADEFARRFLELSPSTAVITNVEADHLDYYGSFGAIESAFADFIAGIHSDGSLLACVDVPMIAAVREDPRFLPYGESPGAAWRTFDYHADRDGTRFTVCSPDKQHVSVNSQLRGRHNALNATAAIAAAYLAGVPPEDAARAVSEFVGTRRRFQTIYCSESLWIVDDYAHHPTEIRATLRAARESHPGRIWAVFQPHTSHRTQALFDDFTRAFMDADEVVILPIYHPAGREPEELAVTSADLVRSMRHSRGRATASMDDAVDLLDSELKSGDMVLLMGAGDVNELGPRLALRSGGAR